MSGRSPAAILYDGEGNPVTVGSDGQFTLAIHDEETRQLLQEILLELKRQNLHWAMATGFEVTNEDTE